MNEIKDILSKYKNIAMIGVSNDPTKASTIVMKYMQKYGYKVYPVNPKAKGQKILGEEVFEKITDIKDKIESHLWQDNLVVTNSWVNVQGEDSRLNFHNHPNSIMSGAIYLKVDDNSSELYFENPNSMYFNYGEPVSVMPVTGMCLMWPSWLKHGSGQSTNKSSERIVLSFNTFFKEGGNI